MRAAGPAGGAVGRRRPLGVVAGLTLSLAFATVALVYVIDALGLPDDLLRNLAIAVLLGFGIALLAPPLAARVEAWIGRIVPNPKAGADRDGFLSGMLLGGSLGFVYAPCAGPILAGVITVSASQSFTAGRLAVALSYAVGSAVVLYFLMVGGRRLTSRLSRHAGQLQMGMGAVMVIVALAMVGDYDTRFQTAIADDLPSVLVNPTRDIEAMDGLSADLVELRGGRREGVGTATAAAESETGSRSGLPVLGAAPDFTGNQEWFERDAGNVGDAIAQNELRYPVVQDNDYATWNAYANQYWPAKYLIDARGRVRYTHFGEGDDDKTEQAIRDLLADAGRRPGGRAHATGEQASPFVTTPESYLGSARADRFVNGPIPAGTRTFDAEPSDLVADSLAFDGTWRIAPDSATAASGSRLHVAFGAQRVFLVLGSPSGRSRDVRVLLDGKPLPPAVAGSDVENGIVTVDRQRLYRLVELPRAERHVLTLELPAGTSGYAFTFG